MAAMVPIVVLQVLLLAGLLPFEEQIGLISIAFMFLVIWFLGTGYLRRSTGRLPGRTLLMSLLGASSFGYPIWAFWLGRHLGRLSDRQLRWQDTRGTA